MENERFIQELNTIIAELKQQVETLTIENELLRAASETHRELNGRLRLELQQLGEKNGEE